MIAKRTVFYCGSVIEYELERKRVKNLNLRVRKDGSVHVSAGPRVALRDVDRFVESHGAFVRNAQERLRVLSENEPPPRQYVSGERFRVLGRELTLQVAFDTKNEVYIDGNDLCLHLRDVDDTAKKQRLLAGLTDQLCRQVFGEILMEEYPRFAKYGVAMPELRIRTMKSRWGSCLVNKGIVTLNRRLLEMPRECIEYVVVHELCHFIHPNHSKQFYGFMAQFLPDWKQRKQQLNSRAKSMQ